MGLVTPESVSAAVAALEARGEKTTCRYVRKELGGSLRDITPILRELRRAKAASPEAPKSPSPPPEPSDDAGEQILDRITGNLRDGIRDLLDHHRNLAMANLTAAQAAADAKIEVANRYAETRIQETREWAQADAAGDQAMIEEISVCFDEEAAKVTSLAAEVADMKIASAELGAQLAALTDQRDAALQAAAAATERVQAGEDRIAELERQLADAKAENGRFLKVLDRVQADADAERQRHETITRMRDEAEQDAAKMRAQMEQELVQARSQQALLDERLSQAIQRADRAEARAGAAQMDMMSAIERFAALVERLTAGNVRVASMTPAAASSLRVSTPRQADADLSLPDQEKHLVAYCERKGWQVGRVYVEPGATGRDDDREVFQEMIEAATGPERPYDIILVHSFSRFMRDGMHFEFHSRRLSKARVSIVSATQEVADDPNGEFFRKMLNLMDEHQSRENAKHTHRAMMENARQGFWNGSRPPFGYATAVAERRGNKDKKVLVIVEEEAATLRLIVDLYLGRHGAPLGLKAICSYLNTRGILRRGHKWGIGSLQDLMTSSTYCGRHLFNRVDSRTGRVRPDSECVEVAVPAIITEEDFLRVQATLHQRSPRQTPPRVVNGPTMLAGVARCAHCGAAMVLNTGKGVYRYYACSRFAKQGRTSCCGQRIRMDRLDGMVQEHLGSKIFDPERLEQMLKGYMETQEAGVAARRERLRHLRDRRGEVQAARTRLITLVETGALEPDDSTLKERLAQLKLQASDLDHEIGALQTNLLAGTPTISAERIRLLAEQMRERFRTGPPELRQAYMKLLLNSVEVGPDAITLTGSNAILERLAAQGASSNAPEVISFALKWRPGRDSNP